MKLLIRPSLVLGAIAGLGFGVLLCIPFIQAFACFAYALIGGGIVFFLKRNSFVGVLSIHDGALIGALAGFAACITSSVIMVPLLAFLSLIPGFGFNLNIFSSFVMFSYSLLVLPLIIFFIALMSALFNAFSGLVVAYIYEKLEIDAPHDGEILIDQE